ncbi:MAG TPA: Gfo/Idh/MocA family oxidoreductase [Acidimicrobiia bacterium]|nr:Gfo/Idh/MocA family oxidoreductase [Acidimicrobiia bacterium]
MSELEPVRWGVLSTADIALQKVIPAMQRSELSPVTAICSRSADKAAAAADSLGITRSYGTYEELLSDDSVEAVYIPLPNHMHLEWTLKAAEAGKHILCEKPLAMTTEDAHTMVDVCDRAGVRLMEAFMYRQHPLWVETKRLLDSAAIGDVQVVDIIFSYFNDDPTNIRNIREAGGGALYDIGCYAINASRMLFGAEPTDVKASILSDESMGVDIVTAAILRFGDGTASFVCSTRMEPDQRVDIYGTEGRLTVEIPFNIPPDRPTRILEVRGGTPPADPGIEVHEIATADPYTVQADAFSRALRTDGPVPVDPRDAVANLEVIEKIFADAGR